MFIKRVKIKMHWISLKSNIELHKWIVMCKRGDYLHQLPKNPITNFSLNIHQLKKADFLGSIYIFVWMRTINKTKNPSWIGYYLIYLRRKKQAMQVLFKPNIIFRSMNNATLQKKAFIFLSAVFFSFRIDRIYSSN